MKIYRIVTLSFLLFFSISCSHQISSIDDYQVFMDLIDQLDLRPIRSGNAQVGAYVVMETTGVVGLKGSKKEGADYIKDNLPSLDLSAILAFKEVNSKPIQLDAKRFNKKKVVLLRKSDFKNMFNTGVRQGWDLFFNTYPDSQGVLTFSSVGFSKDKDQALVYFGNQAGSVSGKGFLIQLEWNGKQWRIENRLPLWIS